MKKYIAIIAVVISIPQSAFAREYAMRILSQDGQQVRFQNGIEYLDVGSTSVSLRFVEPVGNFEKRGQIGIYVRNVGNSTFNFGVENVSAITNGGVNIPIIPFEQLQSEQENRQNWRRFGHGLAAAARGASAASAGEIRGQTTYSSSSNGTVGGYNYNDRTNSTATYNGYDGEAAALAAEKARAVNQQAAIHMNQLSLSEQVAIAQNIQTTTLDPSLELSGIVTFEIPRELRGSRLPIEATFAIKLGDETFKVKTQIVTN